ncbi:MAG: hypothetical protein ACFFFB_04055 [Candidatus Heimdallarchaeota archaeon]
MTYLKNKNYRKIIEYYYNNDFANSDKHRIEIKQRKLNYMQGRLRDYDERSNGTRYKSKISFKPLKYYAELDGKLKHRKRREGD